MLKLISPVVRRTRAAAQVVEHAERAGLPLPYGIEATDYDPQLRLMLRSLAALTEWALALEKTIHEEPIGDRVHHTVEGELLDQRIRLVVVTHNERRTAARS